MGQSRVGTALERCEQRQQKKKEEEKSPTEALIYIYGIVGVAKAERKKLHIIIFRFRGEKKRKIMNNWISSLSCNEPVGLNCGLHISVANKKLLRQWFCLFSSSFPFGSSLISPRDDSQASSCLFPSLEGSPASRMASVDGNKNRWGKFNSGK